jgi:hypothetical protein
VVLTTFIHLVELYLNRVNYQIIRKDGKKEEKETVMKKGKEL